jgi:hypothetical protein
MEPQERTTLEQKINEALKEAIKSGNKHRIEGLRSIRAGIIEFNKSGANRPMTEEEELKLLQNQAKKRRESIEIYEKAGRIDLADIEKGELATIEAFLPKQLDEDEIRAQVKAIIAQSGAAGMKDMGKVMGPAMKALAGRADGRAVQTIVKEILSATE